MWAGTAATLGELQSLTSGFSASGAIQSAEPINIRLRGVNVIGGQDTIGRDIDLVVVTKFQFANQPTVTRLHYMEKGASPGWYDALFQNTVFTTRDFNHDDVTLQIQVYDRDKLDVETVEMVTGLAATVASAVTFPELAEYAQAAASVEGPLTNIINSLSDNDEILDEQVRLEPDEEPNQGTDLLQPGYIVAFNDDQLTADGYRLTQETKLVTADGEPVEDSPYAVLEIEREHNEVEFPETDQKAAKLAAELNGKGESGKDALHYLQQTLESYDKFERIQRGEQLQRLSEQPNISLTNAQQTLLGRLRADPETGRYLK
jgi:hypothetical protein